MLRDDTLVHIGRALGLDCAWLIYHALAREPVDGFGNRVDWITIQARILTE